MKARHFYLVCCVLGLVLPYSQFVPWLSEHGLNVPVFCRELFVNRISVFFAMDVIVSAIVLILVYSKRRQTSAGPVSLVADGWNIGCRCLVWIPAFSFSKAGNIGSNNCSSLAHPPHHDAE
jgi:Terpene cyclase DEP1